MAEQEKPEWTADQVRILGLGIGGLLVGLLMLMSLVPIGPLIGIVLLLVGLFIIAFVLWRRLRTPGR